MTSANIAISPPANGGYKQWLNINVHSTTYGLAAYTLLADTKPSALSGSWHVYTTPDSLILEGGMNNQYAQMIIKPANKTVQVSTRPNLTSPWNTQTFTATTGDVFDVTL